MTRRKRHAPGQTAAAVTFTKRGQQWAGSPAGVIWRASVPSGVPAMLAVTELPAAESRSAGTAAQLRTTVPRRQRRIHLRGAP